MLRHSRHFAAGRVRAISPGIAAVFPLRVVNSTRVNVSRLQSSVTIPYTTHVRPSKVIRFPIVASILTWGADLPRTAQKTEFELEDTNFGSKNKCIQSESSMPAERKSRWRQPRCLCIVCCSIYYIALNQNLLFSFERQNGQPRCLCRVLYTRL